MKIVRLTAENVKKIRVVEITPSGAVVQITGRNGSGKSSVLDAIWWALSGTKHIQSMPIRKGATSARVTLDMGEIVVTRRFTEKDSTLTVENAEGARYRSPQRMLDDLIGALSFDPLAFSRMEPKEQFEELKRLVPLEIDVDQLDGLNRADFADRTEVNRQAKAARAQADGIVVPADLPPAPVDAKALMDRMTGAVEANALIERRKGMREKAAANIADARAAAQQAEDGLAETIAEIERVANERVADYQRQIDALNERMNQAVAKASIDVAAARKKTAELAADLRAQADATQAKLDAAEPLGVPVDVAALRDELDRAAAANAGIERRARKLAFVADAERLEKQSADLTETMAARTKAKEAAIAAAKMPVDGLAFGEGVILYNGIPFDQASSAEQLRVSTAIAMAGNPKLRVLRIKEGSLLDEDGLDLIRAMAEGGDYQVWIEQVDTSGRVGIVMEDGSVVPPPAATAQPALALEA